jgi:hypothetical protein
MRSIDEFSQDYLRQWDKKATVRTKPRYQLAESDAGQDLFPRSLQPLAGHKAVAGRGKDAVHELLVRTAYKWQGAVAILEVDVVADLCGRLASRAMRFALPDSVRHVALTIGTDEMYHAYAAREFIAGVKEATGIDPGPPDASLHSLGKALTHVRQTVPAGLLPEAETMVLCFAENFVTEELFGMSKNTEARSPFHITVREHLIDEGRHQRFFQHLMAHMWNDLDPEARALLGRSLPGFFDAFLGDTDQHLQDAVDLLAFLGFEQEEARVIADEAFDAAYGPINPIKARRKHALHCLELVDSSGMLGDPPTRDALRESGWLAP